MRLIGQQKMGFYPTPPSVVDQVVTWLKFPETPFPALDPCAGEGAALARCVDGTAAVSFGIELDGGRVLEAKEVLNRVLCADAINTARTSHDSWSLLWANPPYDDSLGTVDQKRSRMELEFLRKYTPRLVPDGVLVFIIPQGYAGGDVAKYLAFYYHSLRAWRFEDAEYLRFKQCVIIGRRKKKGFEEQGVEASLSRFAMDGWSAPALDVADTPAYVVPPADPEVAQFEVHDIVPDGRDIERSPLFRRAAMMIGESGERAAGSPPVTPHKGHLALLLAAGEVDGPVGAGDLRHVVRGTAIKEQRIEDRPGTTIHDGIPVQITRRFAVDHFTVSVTAIGPDGTLHTISGAKKEAQGDKAGGKGK